MARTVVVGAGVVGLACAWALRKRGEDVVVLDRAEPGGACSHGNTGWIVPAFSKPVAEPGLVGQSLRWLGRADSPLYIAPRAALRLAPWLWRFWRHCNPADYAHGVAALAAANAATMDLFDGWRRDGLPFEMHRAGCLLVFRSSQAGRAALRGFQPLIASGYPAPSWLDSGELRALEPILSDGVHGGLWFPGEGHVRPESLCAALVDRLRALGVEIRTPMAMTGGDGTNAMLRAVRTAGSEVTGDRFVLAAGAWTGRLAATLGRPLPVQAGKGYSITLRAAAAPTVGRPMLLAEAHVALTPFDGAIRIGGTMELSGINERLDRRRVEAIRSTMRSYLRLPEADHGGVEWTGMRPLTPDGLPLIGRLPGYRNAYVATGHGMIGVTMAPVTGELIAEMVVDGRDPRIAAPFDPARFTRSRGNHG
jgi:D-amino-acid dehydrogenase